MGREPVTRERIERFLRELGRRYRGAGRLYLAGGAQMVYAGFRRQTEDIDYMVRLEGDHEEFTAAVRSLIRELDVSVEPAHPADFFPLPNGREERNRYLGRHGRLDVFELDPISSALAKIERGSNRDIQDALSLVHRGLVHLPELRPPLRRSSRVSRPNRSVSTKKTFAGSSTPFWRLRRGSDGRGGSARLIRGRLRGSQ